MSYYFFFLQVHSRAAGGTGEQCVSDRREHAVSGDEAASGERTAGYETLPVTLQGLKIFYNALFILIDLFTDHALQPLSINGSQVHIYSTMQTQ